MISVAYHRRIIHRNVKSDVLPRIQGNQVIQHGPGSGGKLLVVLGFRTIFERTSRSVSYPIQVSPPDMLCTFLEVT